MHLGEEPCAKASTGQGRWIVPRPPLAKAGRLTLTNLDLNELEFGLSPPLAGRVAVGSRSGRGRVAPALPFLLVQKGEERRGES